MSSAPVRSDGIMDRNDDSRSTRLMTMAARLAAQVEQCQKETEAARASVALRSALQRETVAVLQTAVSTFADGVVTRPVVDATKQDSRVVDMHSIPLVDLVVPVASIPAQNREDSGTERGDHGPSMPSGYSIYAKTLTIMHDSCERINDAEHWRLLRVRNDTECVNAPTGLGGEVR
ncbi:hypothetical protein THASP1DRAFT_33246 [Thamnocephalis sphaerospora]|uniref:Uncharacterized protein n=1 Tax=Thamnocephalis sphaerospora TaxID=78915 RepID=A0A4P9XH03_9FUNG|nr:hypothetical protein THASP1DRAFT_33246 [Thamnocephalis sphaerospora]|eukprot:RKP04934.1 hypothetical protein THASP1DRAFT_33246 [Thamnocephalis sphaerospora]